MSICNEAQAWHYQANPVSLCAGFNGIFLSPSDHSPFLIYMRRAQRSFSLPPLVATSGQPQQTPMHAEPCLSAARIAEACGNDCDVADKAERHRQRKMTKTRMHVERADDGSPSAQLARPRGLPNCKSLYASTCDSYEPRLFALNGQESRIFVVSTRQGLVAGR
jgi:hypothetical protein